METNNTTNNAIETAVLPLKASAIERARIEAQKIIARCEAELTAAGMDLNAAAPYPNSLTTSRGPYQQMQAKRTLFSFLTRDRKSVLIPREPRFVDMDSERCAKFIAESEANAAAQYDAFVAKLNVKVGPVVDAVLSGNHVWGYSFLKVTKTNQTVEIWKTQMIINVSKLGKLFNQFPTRKVKGER